MVLVAIGALAAYAVGSGSGGSAAGSTTTSDSTSTGTGTTTAPVSCAPVKAGAKITTISFRTGTGGCVPAATLLRYRCPIAEAPTIRLQHGTATRRYLGGMYAVTAKKPASAVLVGQTHSTRVYATPAGTVFVSDGGHLRRWLSLPASVPGEGKRTAYMVGDSVMLGAKPQIEQALKHHWVPVVDAAVSRSTPEGLDAINSGKGSDAPAMALQLGTNDGGTPSLYAVSLAAVMRALHAVPFVVWINIGHARSYYAEDDLLIQAQAAKYPNMTVADWADTVPADGVWSDGLHLKPKGAEAMADMLKTYLDGWRSATWSPSAEACNGAVDTAVKAAS